MAEKLNVREIASRTYWNWRFNYKIEQLAGQDGWLEQQEVDADWDGYLDCNSKTEKWSAGTYGILQTYLFEKGLVSRLRTQFSCGRKQNEGIVTALARLLKLPEESQRFFDAAHAISVLAEHGNQAAFEILIKCVRIKKCSIFDLDKLATQGHPEVIQLLIEAITSKEPFLNNFALFDFIEATKTSDLARDAAKKLNLDRYTFDDVIWSLNAFVEFAFLGNLQALEKLRSEELAKVVYNRYQSFIRSVRRYESKLELPRLIFQGAFKLLQLSNMGNGFAPELLRKFTNQHDINNPPKEEIEFIDTLAYLGGLAFYGLNKEATHYLGRIFQNESGVSEYRIRSLLFLLDAILAGNQQASSEIAQLEPEEIAQFIYNEFENYERIYKTVPSTVSKLIKLLSGLANGGNTFTEAVLSELAIISN